MLAAQDTRRFVSGFTLCGSFMRVWEFDWLRGDRFRTVRYRQAGGLQFVTTILRFISIEQEELGFDPTFITSSGERYIEVEQDGQSEHIILDKVMKRARCIADRATTCWKTHLKGYPRTSLVIKDSWHCTDRDEEGDIHQE